MMHYGTEMSALNFGVKGSRSRQNNICWNHHCTHVGIQYSTFHVELDFLVSVAYCIAVTGPLCSVAYHMQQLKSLTLLLLLK